MTIAARMRAIAADPDTPPEAKHVAEKLAEHEESRPEVRVERSDRYSPDQVLPVDHEWAALFADVTAEGQRIAARSHVTICGMARNVEGILHCSIARLSKLCNLFRDWSAVIVENDSTDGTKGMLRELEQQNRGRVTCSMADYGYEHLHGWEPERVARYAKLRNCYRVLSQDRYPRTDFILCVDLDPWGGWSVPGLINGLGWMGRIKDAAAMASTSLYQQDLGGGPIWCHYDTWALRVYGWRHQLLPWKTFFLPPPGAPPIQVCSAFGAGCWYRPEPFWGCEYASDDGDIEHAGLHRRMSDDGWKIFLNPAQRTLMHWVLPSDGKEAAGEGRHDAD